MTAANSPLTPRLLAHAYRDRPGYRPEWAPESVTV